MPHDKRYILLGAAGYIAPRHMRAIMETGGKIVAIADPSDSVGVIDRYFPEAEYFRSARDCLNLMKDHADTVVIATPNHTHAWLANTALGFGYDVICEKPLVTNLDDLEILREAERDTGHRVYCVLQLRHHPNCMVIDSIAREGLNEIEVVYHAPRGEWYWRSWKGDAAMSGGLAMNIGIHIFDLLIWKFHQVMKHGEHTGTAKSVTGSFRLQFANVKYSLSVDPAKQARRSIILNGMEVDLSTGFDNLHTEVYRDILAGGGWGIDDVRPAIEFTSEIKRPCPGELSFTNMR